MGLPMAREQDLHLQVPTNARQLASWLSLQPAQTRSNISNHDIAHFNQHGAFPHRPVLANAPITLRLEIHDSSNSHLPPGIRRPHFDIHPLSAQTLFHLLAVLHRQIPNLPFSRTILEMDDRDGIEASPPMELPAQSTNSTDEMYEVWWQAQFVYGRAGVVVVKVRDTA